MKYGFLSDISDVDFSIPSIPDFTKTKYPQKNNTPLHFYIGTSVWSDKDFKGHFYPKNTPQKNFLLEYAKQFNTVEVNSTRYGTPKLSTLDKWKNSVPDSFKFSFKMPQIISIRKDLLYKDVLSRLDDFLVSMDTMGQKAGTTFILLQNSFGSERLEELDKFLGYLPKEQSFAVEIRNPIFNQSYELYEVLNKHNIANVITDTAGKREVVHTSVSNDTAFIRFVGNGIQEIDYHRINLWIEQIKEWVSCGVTNFYCLHHQPNENRRLSGYSAQYMIQKINEEFPNHPVYSPKLFKGEE
ncbi:MAG: hypothetical protein CMD18_04260 [Flavobacteriales bacterium]|mgnify:FL=1|nr:hypothetical protein [Flavobacteriales bacterium]|tara:strand:+ start:1166 stop:2059 length:894 start_codon:yes stop_codon:yes gene_type:complete